MADDKVITKQRIIVFQQKESGRKKIEGLSKYGAEYFDLTIVDIDDELPLVLDDTSDYLPKSLDCDLVLDFLTHNDLSTDLAELCQKLELPVVGSGKKLPGKGAITPPTCCGLPRLEGLGHYGDHFGAPEFSVESEDGIITKVDVIRGAPCGATWEVAKRLVGHPVDDAGRKAGLDTQFYCYAEPGRWDPIYGKSPVHFAGKIHDKQMQKAISILESVLQEG
ncbi:DUF166 family (seleno)protein DfsP [Desulforhopalus sp. 52FAK]